MSDSSTTLTDRDRAVVWHPFTQHETAPTPLAVVSAKGAYLHLADGRKLLDGIASWWTSLHGHSHPKIAAAIAHQAEILDHVLLAGVTHPGAVEVAERLVAMLPAGLSRVFYSECGSAAVEIALKLCFQYHVQSGAPQRRRFIALKGAYHGDTLLAMSVSDPADYHRHFEPMMYPHVTRVSNTTVEGPDGLAAALAEYGDEVAAVIVEPLVQGAGGMLMQPAGFLADVARLTKASGALLVADEVMTGFGRTGTMFACDAEGVTPDVLCVAKGLTGGVLPLAATVATDQVFEAFSDPEWAKAFSHGHTFTGNPITCAAAVASLKLLAEEDVLGKVAALEAFYAERLPRLAALDAVASVRFRGAIGAVELATPASEKTYFNPLGPQVAQQMLDKGYLIRPLGPVLYTLPPYCVGLIELGELYDALESIIATL